MAKKRRAAKKSVVKTRKAVRKTRSARPKSQKIEPKIEMGAEEMQCECGSGLAKSNCCGSV
jgi:hypothetical protein